MAAKDGSVSGRRTIWALKAALIGFLGAGAAQAETPAAPVAADVTLLAAESPVAATAEPTSPRGARFDCLIEPRETIELASETNGVVAEMLAGRGDRIRKGQVLARLADSIEVADLAIAEAKAAAVGELEAKRAQADYETRRLARHQRAIRAGAVTAQTADEIRAAHQVAQGAVKAAEEEAERLRREVERAKARLAAREVRSPIDGVVLQRNLSPGESVENDPLFTIVALDPLHVEVFLPVALSQTLTKGDAAEVFVGGREAPLAAEIDVIDPVADAASGTFKARLTLPNPGFKVMAGLGCGAGFPAAR